MIGLPEGESVGAPVLGLLLGELVPGLCETVAWQVELLLVGSKFENSVVSR